MIQSVDQYKDSQNELLNKLSATVNNKQKDLLDLRQENDLSEKGIASEPKPFKSVTAENNALFALNSQITELNKNQNDKINELETLYNERIKKGIDKKDPTNQQYLKTIEFLKAEQAKVIRANTNLLMSLEEINRQTEIERKRRIKRASYENIETRFSNDSETLQRLKETTPLATTKLKPEDFNYGEPQANMQILKNISNAEKGFYTVIAVHNDAAKRDEFLTKVISTGQKNVNFFYDVRNNKYYIYYNNKLDNLEDATRALESKGNTPYNGKMVIIKVEN